MNLRVLLSGLPVAVFYTLTRLAPAWVAITGGFLASVFVFWIVGSNGLIRFLTLFGLAVLAVAGTVGILVDSDKAYLASGPIADLLWPLLHAGSILAKRPIVGAVAKELVPALARPIPANDRLFVWLSVMWGALDLVRGVILLWFLGQFSVGEYIVYSRMLNWPINMMLLTITIVLISKRARLFREQPALAGVPATA